MRIATITEAKNRLSALIDRVRAGESILIVDRGRPVARLVPAVAVDDEGNGRLSRLERAGVVRIATTKAPLTLIASSPPSQRGEAGAVKVLLDERRKGR